MILSGKRALITGGSSGIGFAAAQALGEKGVALAITGRRPDRLAAAVDALRKAGTSVSGIVADVATTEGRRQTLDQALGALGGLDILVNNAGGVRAGRLEHVAEEDILAMIAVDLIAPILLTRAALPALRTSGEGMVVNVSSGLGLVGAPFYATYAGAKAGLARFGEALRRELKGEGVHVLTVYPSATDTPMMASNTAGPELGFSRESAEAVAAAIVAGVEAEALEVIRGGEARAAMIALNRDDPLAIDARFLDLKARLEVAVKGHAAL
ncbi:SDR family oxidoreductase [Azospirillum sp. TSA6c]|uniref:SDR family NAD(P)-dependent oxidoreductase n=1 Tax=unclassified Azospirillum TaxID=2630922 RepID=UPI000D61F312|nr:SDR family NAD(P)-dependent oxidoreductase [Azospirillum sp. TSA6c]PWC47340.1 oxidoreductase [Azospirillum sp. TSA6c]PWC54046.1 oxidoreductase [Azospirillum sp. TSA6c]